MDPKSFSPQTVRWTLGQFFFSLDDMPCSWESVSFFTIFHKCCAYEFYHRCDKLNYLSGYCSSIWFQLLLSYNCLRQQFSNLKDHLWGKYLAKIKLSSPRVRWTALAATLNPLRLMTHVHNPFYRIAFPIHRAIWSLEDLQIWWWRHVKISRSTVNKIQMIPLHTR